MNSRLSQAVPGHARAQSTANLPEAAVTPTAREGGSLLPPPGLLSREAEEYVFFNSGGLGIRFIFLLKSLPHVQTSCTGWCNLRTILNEEVTPTAYTKQGKRFQITSCHGATSFYIIAKLGFGWLVFFNKLFRNISWSKPKERILIYPIPFISNWIHLFRVSASSTFHSTAMWILLISLQNSQSPLVSLTIIQPPSNEKLLWSSPFASSPKNISIKKNKKNL